MASALRPLTPEQIELLRPMWAADDVRYVYATNAIAGSSLTLGETYVVLGEEITIGGKPLSDHVAALNGNKALQYVNRLVDDGSVLTAPLLLDLHQIVVGGGETACSIEDLKDIFEDYSKRRETDHPVVLAADLHFGIVHVHPFKDGNGRTARLAMNLHLVQSGYPPLAIMPPEKPEYIEMLERAHHGDIESFRAFIERLELAEIKRYLEAIHRAYGDEQ